MRQASWPAALTCEYNEKMTIEDRRLVRLDYQTEVVEEQSVWGDFSTYSNKYGKCAFFRKVVVYS